MKELIDKIIDKEWNMFKVLKNTGGIAECQNNKEEFIIMRSGQWDSLPEKVLKSYYQDLIDAENIGRNLLQEKYIKMMEFSASEEFEKVKHLLYDLTPGAQTMINQIEKIYMNWGEEFEKKFPKFSSLCRPLKKEGDLPEKASVQTYLKGELSSYSPRTILFYLDYVKECEKNGINLIYETHTKVVNSKGFKTIEEIEAALVL